MKLFLLLVISGFLFYNPKAIASSAPYREIYSSRESPVYCVAVSYRDPRSYCAAKDEYELKELISSYHVGHLILSTPNQLLSLYPGKAINEKEKNSLSSHFFPSFQEKEGEKDIGPLGEALESIQMKKEKEKLVPSLDYRTRAKLASVPHSTMFFFLDDLELKALDAAIEKLKGSKNLHYVPGSHKAEWSDTHNCVTCIATVLIEAGIQFLGERNTEIYTPLDGYKKIVEYVCRNERKFHPTVIIWKDFKSTYQSLYTFNRPTKYSEKTKKYEESLKKILSEHRAEFEEILAPLTTEESLNFILSNTLAVKDGVEERIKKELEKGTLKVSKVAYYQLDQFVPRSSVESNFHPILGNVSPSFIETVLAWNDFSLETSDKRPYGIEFLGSPLFSAGISHEKFTEISSDSSLTGGVRLSKIAQIYPQTYVSSLSFLVRNCFGVNSLEEKYVFKEVWQKSKKWIYGSVFLLAAPVALKVLKWKKIF